MVASLCSGSGRVLPAARYFRLPQRSTSTCTFWMNAGSIGSSTVVDSSVSSIRFCEIRPWRANEITAVAGKIFDLIASLATSPGL